MAALVDAVAVEVGNHSVAMPFGQLGRVSPIYPSVALSAEHRWVDRGVFDLAQDLRLGVRRHGVFGTSAVLGIDLIARFTASAGPTAEVGVGVGAADHWRAREVLAWDEEAGTWTPAPDRGRLGASFGFGLGVGVDLSRFTDAPVTALVAYRWSLDTGFLPALPLGPHGTLGFALRWSFGGAA